MEQDEYLKQRVDDQIKWYDRKSGSNRRWYKRLRLLEICAVASIPFLAGYISDAAPIYKLVVGLLGVVIAIITAVVSLYQF